MPYRRGQEKHWGRGSRPVQPLGASKDLLGHSHRGLHLSKELNFWSCKVSNLGLWSSVMKVIAWIKLSVDELLVTSSENVVSFAMEGRRKEKTWNTLSEETCP